RQRLRAGTRRLGDRARDRPATGTVLGGLAPAAPRTAPRHRRPPVPAMTDDLTATSRFLSYALRHNPGAIGITLDEAGWIDVETLPAAMTRHNRPIDRDTLDMLVAGTDKQRFQLRGERIRAAQGHSIPVDLQLDPMVPPGVLYHGTVRRFLPSILATGL